MQREGKGEREKRKGMEGRRRRGKEEEGLRVGEGQTER